ncbi:TFIIS N-terminal domain-containing protein [Heracleum sosnowskyi]|uniref:TFIIS N-terminal domain-containing protein n=1 Tax=Heracleum sosnowskyi TaxID=360622 RepID=A0AAD8HEH3_9APIA|nr:TFIIS N-terminal domain-containing protein [Heracleum sosnowskyi]
MAYDNDPYRDEDGEPLMDMDDAYQSDQEPEPVNQLDDDDDGEWRRRDRSPTPVYDDDSKSRPRKRLIKKSGGGGGDVAVPDFGLGDEDVDDVAAVVRDESDGEYRSGSVKKSGGKGKGKGKMERREKSGGERREKFRVKKRSRDVDGDKEVKEMWDTIAGGDSEDDQDGVKMADDDNFIDDTGVDPADRYGSDNEPHSPGNAPQAEEGEEDDEMKDLFKMEEDAKLNMLSKPAINKLKKLPLLTEVLSKKQLQQEFLDHGVLTLLKNWLEPLPDGSLPNINIRAAILKILTDFPIDLEQFDRREQLKKSGLGKVIMFLSKSDEEITANRKIAKDLVDKWSRPIFNKSTRFEDMRNIDDERAPFRRPSGKKPINKAGGMQSRDDDFDLAEFSQESKSSQSSSRQHASRPEAMPLDFMVRPQSKIDPDEIRARAKQTVQDQRRLKMNKKLQQLKAPKKKQLQATKLSVEGRGMVKYL